MTHIDLNPDEITELINALARAIRQTETSTAAQEQLFRSALKDLVLVVPIAEIVSQVAEIENLLYRSNAISRDLQQASNMLLDSLGHIARQYESAESAVAAAFSVGQNPSPEQTEKLIPYLAMQELYVEVYLDTDDSETASAALRAVDRLARSIGAYKIDTIETRRGSIFRRSEARFASVFDGKSVQERLQSIERLVELWQIDPRQAQVDQQTADALAKVINSLETIPRACIRFGSLLIVKYEDAGHPVLLSRQLSQPEIWAFERYPELQTRPENIFTSLALAASGSMKSAEGDKGYTD
jgi:hypothetical protein